MKKIISFLVAGTLLSSVAYANTIEIDSVNISDTAITVNYNTDGLSESDQVTVLTYKADSADVTPDENNIKYIDQITKSTDTAINFSLASAPIGTYQIKMGGTDIEAPDAISITVDESMKGSANFVKNEVNLYTDIVDKPFVIKDELNKHYVVKPENNYIVASASVPTLDGYTVKEYGIRLNSNNYSAKIALTTENKFGILFTGAEDEINVSATPYVIYEKEGEEPITYYGTTKNQAVKFER